MLVRVYVRTHTKSPSRGQRRQTPNGGQTTGEKSRETGEQQISATKRLWGKMPLCMIIKNKNKCTLLVKYFHLAFFMRCFVCFPILRHVGIFRRWNTRVVFVIENIHLKEILSTYIFPLYFSHEVNSLMATHSN